MAKYVVTLLYDASEGVEVEADSPEEAINVAHDKAEAMLCHQCSRHLELGDIYKEIVSDESGNEISMEKQP